MQDRMQNITVHTAEDIPTPRAFTHVVEREAIRPPRNMTTAYSTMQFTNRITREKTKEYMNVQSFNPFDPVNFKNSGKPLWFVPLRFILF
ncbi:hypothetical protein [Enterocloster citroniae]|uniref:hypothetical protein n=1 Tax=Enterocloster citroniae TaxID=358743 RepID=UPI002E7636D1|nr:hypothetical protein [Enterocloster citroniae]